MIALSVPHPRWESLAGLALLLAVLGGRLLGSQLLGQWFTPLMWTGYIALVDGLVGLRGGRRLLDRGWGSLAWLGLASLAFWLYFEAYNARLGNWVYVGLAEPLGLRLLGYVWSFATILPAIEVSRRLLLALGLFEGARFEGWSWPGRHAQGLLWVGVAMLLVAAVVPPPLNNYLFGLVWMGTYLVLDTYNYRAGRWSTLGELEAGRPGEMLRLLVAGLWAALLWESWNMLAIARWIYDVPFFPELKLFEMPLLGYLGYPPFVFSCAAIVERLGMMWRSVGGGGAPSEAAPTT